MKTIVRNQAINRDELVLIGSENIINFWWSVLAILTTLRSLLIFCWFEKIVADTLFWVKDFANHELVVCTGMFEFKDEWGIFLDVGGFVIIIFDCLVSMFKLTNVNSSGFDIIRNVIRKFGQVIIQILRLLQFLPEVLVFLLK